MELILTSAFLITWLTASVRLAGPLLLAALGEIVGESSGVLNVAIEGLMLIGALTGFMVALWTHDPWLGVIGATLVCLVFALVLAWMYITVQANMAVVGIIFN